jgi:DNA-binding transcriptional LysR family regulator
MDAISLDQLRVFLQVVKSGSFSAAARDMHRVQSAVTYAIQKLEDQLGAKVFDRSGYRPKLSDAGRALLPRATRVLEEFSALNEQARAIAGGLEPELSFVVDASYPMPLFLAALQEFEAKFPAVLLRVYVENLGAAVQAVIDRRADFGLTFEFAADSAELVNTPIGEMQLVPVAAPSHPLGQVRGRVPLQALRDARQLVLSDRTPLTQGKEFSVISPRTWRLADLGARHAMLRAGLGWGNMPLHLVEADIAEGRLVKLDIRWPDGSRPPRPIVVLARRKDKTLGPAGAWLAERFSRRSGGVSAPSGNRGSAARRAR